MFKASHVRTAALTTLSAFASAHATSAPSMPLGQATLPPAGYVAFCSRLPGECDFYQDARSRPPMDLQIIDGVPALVELAPPCDVPQGASAAAAPSPQDVWEIVKRENLRINQAIAPRQDRAAYGVDDYWSEPLEAKVGFGDCEDYALEKRRALIAAGVPRSSLSLAVVETGGNDHVVLLAAIGGREYVLDNLTADIRPWDQTGYRWLERQTSSASSQWVRVLSAGR